MLGGTFTHSVKWHHHHHANIKSQTPRSAVREYGSWCDTCRSGDAKTDKTMASRNSSIGFVYASQCEIWTKEGAWVWGGKDQGIELHAVRPLGFDSHLLNDGLASHDIVGLAKV
jgi:hypothetical protein